MMFHGGGWFVHLNAPEEKPRVTWRLLQRVLRYARPYWGQLAGMLLMILTTTGLTLLTPLILRDLIDTTLPSGNVGRLGFLALALLLIPAFNGGLSVWQRRINSLVGEGVIHDLRVSLYRHLQAMSLRFFTNTRVGELMSRLNNDVVGAQNAISNTIVNILTNLVQATALLVVMGLMEWRLTLISVLILPLFILAARRLGKHLRVITRQQMEANAQMNAMMNETLNISGALLVKLFGRTPLEVERFGARAAQVRDLGVRRAVMSSVFFVIVGLLSAVGTALVFGMGGYLVIQGAFTIGTIVAFGTYLGSLYGALQGLANAPVEFATSVVSFERVFEVIDLPLEIEDRPGASVLREARGVLELQDVTFRYEVDPSQLLRAVPRMGQMQDVMVFSGGPGGPGLAGGPPGGPAPVSGNGQAGAVPLSQARENALEHVSFKAEAGQLVALVGPSGAGKTTLTYLIPRLYDPTEGRILVDGHDLREVQAASLRSQMGVVPQEVFLFSGTTARTSPSAAPAPRASRSRPRRAPSAPTSSSPG